MINKLKIKNKGFTLVEMLVAVSLFTVITSFAIGAILSIFDANRRAQSTKTVVDNLNFALENLTRSVRFGNAYYCGISSNPSATNDCSAGDTSLSVTLVQNGVSNRILYRLNGNALQRADFGLPNYYDMTSSEVVIQHLRFYVIGTSSTFQPYVIAVIKGYVGNKPTAQSSFSIQTMMSQRELNL